MATEQLKVFANTADTVSTSAITNVTIKATSSSEQAVLKTISYEAVDPEYPVTTTLTNGNAVLFTPKTTAKTVKNSEALAGSQIVDVSSTVNIEFDTGADIYSAFPQVRAVLFDGTDGFNLIDNSAPKFISPTVAETEAEALDGLRNVVKDANGSVYQARSAFMSTLNGTLGYTKIHPTGRLFNYDKEGNQIGAQSSTLGGGTKYGACADSTYAYAKDIGLDTQLTRITLADGLGAALITMSENVEGVAGNTGGYMLYYNGFIYIRKDASATQVKKINAATGAVTSITVLAASSYSVGACITKDVAGVFHIVELNSLGWNKINLSTDTYTSYANTILTISTEYGNTALEIGYGIVAFPYNTHHVIVNINTNTISPTAILNSSTDLFPTTVRNNIDATSIANYPLYDQTTTQVARSVTHKVYADGVLIEGAE